MAKAELGMKVKRGDLTVKLIEHQFPPHGPDNITYLVWERQEDALKQRLYPGRWLQNKAKDALADIEKAGFEVI